MNDAERQARIEALAVTKSFSWALEVLKAGGKVSRPVWGKGAYVVLQKGYPDGIPINANTAEVTGEPEGTVMVFQPYLMMRTANGSFVPWMASTDNVLAEDWQEGANEPKEIHGQIQQDLERVMIPSRDFESLKEDRAELYALQAAGVDNWEGYATAMAILRENQV